MKSYTEEDYKQAKQELNELSDKFDRYSGNNPNKYRSEINEASRKVKRIEDELKKQGILERSDSEQRDAILDKEFPNARRKETVVFNGERFMKIFYPADKSLSGKTVHEWGSYWKEVS